MDDNTMTHYSESETFDTPYHKNLRDDMSIRSVRYGFFKVAKERVSDPVCSRCSALAYKGVRINGILLCVRCSSESL